ncbi:pirin family protein [Paenibacillus sp. NPDC058071]|uniref:pirin family protein n=1 Tax=Paenibacillus sp. NPDC058071 TaxID=3346326 RepID=UPI0036DB47CC
MAIRIYSVDQQASGQFDEGNITEQKPIGFPGEGSAVERVGTLFYWAWFQTKREGSLPLHPHRGFEILSYLLEGTVQHQDTLGNEQSIGAGGLQIMQTGTGVQHAEKYGKDTSGFQIWFEPFMGEAYYATPTYADYEDEDFPVEIRNQAKIKTILGTDSPIRIVADAQMWDLTLPAGQSFEQVIPEGYSIAGLVVEGESTWKSGIDTHQVSVNEFVVCEAEQTQNLHIQSKEQTDSRIILIQVPSVLPYPSYKEIKIRIQSKS